MRRILFSLFVTLLATGASQAQVAALGASNTRGFDLPFSDAYPAKLQALLRAKGYNVTVANEGVNGDTSDGMLSRFDSAAPAGTRVLILECCGNDNKAVGRRAAGRFAVADHVGNIRGLVLKARRRGIAVVFLGNRYQGEPDASGAAVARASGAILCGGMLKDVPPEHQRPSSAGLHADAVGYDIVAHRLLPCVIRALGKAR